VSAAAATAAAALLEARRAIAAEAAAAAAVASQRLARHAEQLHTAVATESKAIREEAAMVTANVEFIEEYDDIFNRVSCIHSSFAVCM
jgi:hypothetical protein